MAEVETPGQRLKKLRQKEDLSQGKLAKRVGISESYISYLEADARQPSWKVLHRLAAYFGVEPVFLRHGTTIDHARQALMARRAATQRSAIRMIREVFARCSAGDVVTCETQTLTKNDQQVTTITLVRERVDQFLDEAPAGEPASLE